MSSTETPIRITAARLHRVRLPLVHEFRTSSHRKTELDHILVELEDASGAVGWGEIASPSDPYYAPETVESCWHIAERYLLPALVGQEWGTPEQVPRFWAKVRGNQFAKAGVDVAAWVLWSAVQGVPLAKALGGTRSEVTAGVSLGIEPTIDDLLIEVRRQVDAGYPRVKLKIAPGWDVEPVRAVRAEFPDLDLHVDANGIYSESADHLTALVSLDEFGLTMIEQPFAPRDLLAHTRLQRAVQTPVCLDESVETLGDLETALSLESLRVLNIKVSRMGGLTVARAAHDLAQQSGIAVWCGGMHEFGIGRAANVALSSLPGFTLPSDVSASDKYYARDVITPTVTAHQGVVRVPATPGLGHAVDTELIAANTISSTTCVAT
ncbi:O-succinylbenzoate synthase [Kribbella sp. VKM Ac-2527]|uniref:o-succinylbenzoate synthase n=1 Tax=Kribbella caucasensis TaxID=2512215 RepID=A0A4R6JEH1_9ACTN|nr:o-succinylbenzoate synthase [Kribbella sp. VKM Ac-2527]TDO34274.1 O-succinylbenzoate synthase [Kribbella sp. VKM Ac-2527]